MQPIKVGIIGCGKQAPKHISGLRNSPGVELVLADINYDIARSLADRENLQAYRSPDDIFQDETIAAVDICTPTPSHFPLISKALKTGKHFFCEKPLCEDLNTAQQIGKLSKDSNRIGMIGYIYRFAPVFEKAFGICESSGEFGQSEALGRIVHAFFRIGGRGSHQVWKHQKESGGGAINEMLVHMVDLALWFFGEVDRVNVLSCDLMRPNRIIQGKSVTADAEDNIIVQLHMKCGTTVTCQADLLTPAFSQYAEIQGESGTFMGSIQADMPSFVFCEEGVDQYKKGKNILNFEKTNLFERQMKAFIDAVRVQKDPMRSTIMDSIRLIEVMDEIKRRTKIQ
mgnify:CR=1 FL=1